MDNLDRCMILCERDGYGVHYGAWRATQGDVLIVKEIPDGWKKCEFCGKPFKPSHRSDQRFCEAYCQTRASELRFKQKKKEKKKHFPIGDCT